MLVALDEDSFGGAVSPEVLRVGVGCWRWGNGNGELVFMGVGWGELGARGYWKRVVVRGCLAGDAVVREGGGVEEKAGGLVGHFSTCAGGLDGVSELEQGLQAGGELCDSGGLAELLGVGEVAEVVCELHEEPPALGRGKGGECWTCEHGSGPCGRRGAAGEAGDQKGLVE